MGNRVAGGKETAIDSEGWCAGGGRTGLAVQGLIFGDQVRIPIDGSG